MIPSTPIGPSRTGETTPVLPQSPASLAIDKSDQRVRRMFGSIAGRYDFLNHLLSLNIDRSWRSFTTRVAAPEPGSTVLDCCTGTADLALAFDRVCGGTSRIVGTDFCREIDRKSD